MSEPTASGHVSGRTPYCAMSAPGSYGLWEWRNVMVNVILDKPSMAVADAMVEHAEQMVAAHPEGFSSITYLQPGFGLAKGPVRARFADVAKTCDPGIRLSVLILSGGGFWASTMQSAATSVQIMSRSKLKLRICTSIDEVLIWFPREHVAKTGTATPPEQLATAVHYAIKNTR